MKKNFLLILTLLCCFLFFGCISENGNENDEPSIDNNDDNKQTEIIDTTPIINSKFSKNINYGLEEEKAIYTSKRVENYFINQSDSNYKDENHYDKKISRLTRNKPNQGIYQIDGLSGYFRFVDTSENDFDDKALSETLLTFNSVLYSILLNDEFVEFNGVTFSSSETEIFRPIRIDIISDEIYMITTEYYIEVIGIYNGLEFYLNVSLEDNSFNIYSQSFNLSYSSSTSSFAKEKKVMLNYLRTLDEIISKETFEFIYDKFTNNDEIVTRNNFLKENVNYFVRSRNLRNNYYKNIVNNFNYKRNDKVNNIIKDGKLIMISTDNGGTTIEIPDTVVEISSFDNYQNYGHKFPSLFIPTSVKTFDKLAIDTLCTSVIFTEYTYEEMPAQMREDLLKTLERREIFYKDQFVVDENYQYIPLKYYLRKIKTNKNNIEVEEALMNIVDYSNYESLLTGVQIDYLNNEICNLYNLIYNSESIDEINSLIEKYNTIVLNIVDEFGSVSFETYFNKTLESLSYRLETTYTLNDNKYMIEESSYGNNIVSICNITNLTNPYGAVEHYNLFEYNDCIYNINEASRKYIVYESREAYTKENQYVELFKKMLKDLDISGVNYDETKGIYFIENNDVSLEFEVEYGYISSVKGRMNDYLIETMHISFVNAINIYVDSYHQKYLPNINTKFEVIRNIYYELLNDNNPDYIKIIDACNHITTLPTIEEKEAYYLDILQLTLSYFDYETFNLYYLNENHERVYLNKDELPGDLYVRLYREPKDITKYIKKVLASAYFDEGVVNFILYDSEDENKYYDFYYECGVSNPSIKVHVGSDTYSFIRNNNNKYIVIINNQYVETIETLEKYNDILSKKDRYDAILEFLNNDELTFVHGHDDYYINEKYKDENFVLEYKGHKYELEDVHLEENAKIYTISINFGQVILHAMNFGDSVKSLLTDIEIYIYNQHIND